MTNIRVNKVLNLCSKTSPFQFVLEECDDVDDFVKIRISSCLKASISPTAVDEQETLKNLGLGYTMMVCNSGY